MIGKKSRYANVEIAQWTDPSGRKVPYLRRRFLPSSKNVIVMSTHSVVGGDRLDLVTARKMGDPELFWRVADANDAMRPDELTEEVGRLLVVPMPTEGSR
jgi:hypothetical protein